MSKNNIYNTFFINSPVVMLLIHPKTMEIIDANSSACSFYQYSYKEILKLKISDINVLSKEEIAFEMEQARNRGKNHFDFKHRLSNGEIRDVEVHSRPIVLNGVEILYSIIHDTTERNKAEEERLVLALQSSGDGVWDWNTTTNEVVYSKRWKEMIGYEDEEISNSFDEWVKRLHPDDRDSAYLQLNRHLEGLTPIYQSEHRLLCKDGSYKWILSRGKVISWNADGKPLRVTGTHKDITSRKQMENLLREAEERFRNILEYSQDASYRRDLKSKKYDYISPVIERLTGYTSQEMSEMTIDMFLQKVYPEDVPQVIKYFKEECLANNAPQAVEYRFLCKDGNYHWFINRFTSVQNNLEPLYRYGIIQEITERKLAEEELKRAKEKAEKASITKSEFLANMSHELRTPLNVTLGAIQLFELYINNDLDLNKEKILKHLKSMKQNSFRLLKLVNNLIDTNKIDSGFYEPIFYKHNIVSVIERIALSVSDYAEQKNINLIFDSDIKEMPIICDVDMIDRIMLNVLSNAIKFTDDFIYVNISTRDDVVVITVKDNGIGIEQDKLEIIFERYRQAADLLTRENEGSGIGLSLTKSLVEMHGGKIYVKSDYGNGCEFIIELPIEQKVGETMLHPVQHISDNHKFIEMMNVEFSDIYK